MRSRIPFVIGASVVVLAISCSDPIDDRSVLTAPESPLFAKGGNPNKVKSISVSPSSATLSVGGTLQLTATANPPGSATSFDWSTSNAAVATVNGTTRQVTAVGPGTATISAAAGGKTGRATITVSPPPPPADAQVLVGAGDIASCNSSGDEATANVLDGISGTVFTLGDNAYSNGTISEYNDCYGPTWGRHKARTRPSPGNHEYNTTNAAGYYQYFGADAGDPAKGYYSYDLGDWHIVVLNSNRKCIDVACDAESEQVTWLRADLEKTTKSCTLAYWHHPRFNSGSTHGNTVEVAALWDALYDYDAEIVLNGHEHVYERFAPQTPNAVASATGIRQFTVGTGGVGHYNFKATPEPNSEVRNNTAFGVLKLSLYAGGYQWQFVAAAGSSFTDSGTGTCH